MGPPSWSPDSTKLVFAGTEPAPFMPLGKSEFRIYVVNADGSDDHAILGPEVLGTDMILSMAWSPDGSTISFVRFTLPSEEQREARLSSRAALSLWMVDPDGSNPRAVTGEEFTAVFYPAWSPDGSQLAFVGLADPANTGIYRMNADGTNVLKLAEGLKGDPEAVESGDEMPKGSFVMAPSWSPDGGWISYLTVPVSSEVWEAAWPLKRAELRLVAADGTEQRTILEEFYVEPVMDPFDSMGSVAPAWSTTRR
jgi:Tol biopolymer transport system component